jgi:hypothetical protein
VRQYRDQDPALNHCRASSKQRCEFLMYRLCEAMELVLRSKGVGMLQQR